MHAPEDVNRDGALQPRIPRPARASEDSNDNGYTVPSSIHTAAHKIVSSGSNTTIHVAEVR